MNHKETLKKIANLSRLEIEDSQSDNFFSKIIGVLDYMKKVQNHKFLKGKDIINENIILRDDNVTNIDDKNLTSQFIDRDNGLLKVKKIL